MLNPLTNNLTNAMVFVMDIKGIRERLGLTQEQLANKLGVSWATVARWERGKGKPSPLARKALEKLLKESTEKETE